MKRRARKGTVKRLWEVFVSWFGVGVDEYEIFEEEKEIDTNTASIDESSQEIRTGNSISIPQNKEANGIQRRRRKYRDNNEFSVGIDEKSIARDMPSTSLKVMQKCAGYEEKSKEKEVVGPDDLCYTDVVHRYLTTRHNSVPAVFDFYQYYRAEFACMLSGITRVKIRSSNGLRAKDIKVIPPRKKGMELSRSTKRHAFKDFVVIDVETTGLNPCIDEIIELSAIRFCDFVPVAVFSTLIKPKGSIPADATSINGITDSMVQNSPEFSSIVEALEDFIGEYPIVAHNSPFDIGFLASSGMRFSKNFYNYDTLELSRQYIRDYAGRRLEKYKLAFVCNECNIYFDQAHRSLTDALATGLLFIEIIKTVFDVDDVFEAGIEDKDFIEDRALLEGLSLKGKLTDNVLLVYPDMSYEYIPCDAVFCSYGLRYLWSPANEYYHTHLDCYATWPQVSKEQFFGWGLIKTDSIEKHGVCKCPHCERIDRAVANSNRAKSYREVVDEEWEKYRSSKAVMNASVVAKGRIFDEDVYRVGEELTVDDSNKRSIKFVFGLTAVCTVPKRIREFCFNEFDNYKFFITASVPCHNNEPLLFVSVYKRKFWNKKKPAQ